MKTSFSQGKNKVRWKQMGGGKTAEFLPQFEKPRRKLLNSKSVKRKRLFYFRLFLSHIPNRHTNTHTEQRGRSKHGSYSNYQLALVVWPTQRENLPRCGSTLEYLKMFIFFPLKAQILDCDNTTDTKQHSPSSITWRSVSTVWNKKLKWVSSIACWRRTDIGIGWY